MIPALAELLNRIFQSPCHRQSSAGLGIIYLSFQQGYLPRERAIQLLETLKLRRDIWISTRLCDKVLRLVRTQQPNSPTT
jgi:Domain of unknown function (DUF3368)